MPSPAEHYQAAEDILERLDDRDITLPFGRALLTKAHVHALLAQCAVPLAEDYDEFLDGPHMTTRYAINDRL